MHKCGLIGASPDRISPKCPLEIKCPASLKECTDLKIAFKKPVPSKRRTATKHRRTTTTKRKTTTTKQRTTSTKRQTTTTKRKTTTTKQRTTSTKRQTTPPKQQTTSLKKQTTTTKQQSTRKKTEQTTSTENEDICTEGEMAAPKKPKKKTSMKYMVAYCEEQKMWVIDRNHNYYHQVQAQIYFTNSEMGLFFVWTPHTYELFEIKKDPGWAINIPILINFYFQKFIPHILSHPDADIDNTNKAVLGNAQDDVDNL